MATSTAQDFKARRYDTIELPSGLVVQARRGGIDVFIKSGRVPNSLMPILKAAMVSRDETDKTLASLEVSPEMLGEVLELFDIVTINSITAPLVYPVPAEGERSDDKLYVDEIEAEDKQFIFQWAVGGTSDLEKFRQRSSEPVELVHTSEEVAVPAKLAVGDS